MAFTRSRLAFALALSLPFAATVASAKDADNRAAFGGPAMRARIKKVLLKEPPDDVLTPAQAPVPSDAKKLEKPAPAPKKGATKKAAATGKAPGPRADTGLVVGENKATPLERLRVKKDFRVELLYSVPNLDQGSWVNLCLDNKGRILASDQYGGLYRFPPPPPGRPLDPAAIEKVPADIRAVNGMAWAFGALYVAANDYEKKIPSGLYRITDSDGDDRLDRVERLRVLQAGGDHGVHAVVPAPDGRSLFLVTGNATRPAAFSASRVPPHWGEDNLLPRLPDGRGRVRSVLAPAGIIYRVSPDGEDFEVYSSGYRNVFDAAFNRDGELFTFDSDTEADFNTPWYRPTRLCHVVSGSEFGWRDGAGPWPAWYPDSLPPVLDIGPGSPTGMTFGYGAKFPAKYQEALYILDWSWGRLYAVHLEPDGAGYSAVKEEFLSGAPLPMTDALIHPSDGALYFAIGGRKVQSGLYRVTYAGRESTAPVRTATAPNEARALRRRLEGFHGKIGPEAVTAAWPYLGHADRFIRWAARTAVEHQDPAIWADRALTETDAARKLEALLALARVTGIDPSHRKPGDPPADRVMQAKILAALERLDWDRLGPERRIALVRTYQICLNRFGRPDEDAVHRILSQLDPRFPAPARELNWLLCETLVYLQSPTVAARAVALLEQAPTQEEQMEYARSLRMLKDGWTRATRAAYFRWFLKAASYRGGEGFEKSLELIRNDAVAGLSEAERAALHDVLAEKPVRRSPGEGTAGIFAGRTAKAWTLEELSIAARDGMRRRDYENGRRMFAAASCFACHRFGGEGGVTAPDLTGAGGRYTPHDLLDQVLNPSKEINEQYMPMVITTRDEEIVSGVIVNLSGDRVTVNTDPADPGRRVAVDRKEVVSIEPSKVSPMPTGLLNLLTEDEVLDLLAYVLSGGNPQHEVFRE